MKKRQSYYFNLATKLICLFRGEYSRSRINTGYCWFWASLVNTMLPETVICKVQAKDNYHVFIKLDGLYFDSEHRMGKADWKELRSYKRILQVDPVYTEGYSQDQVLLRYYLKDSFFSNECAISDYMFIIAEYSTKYTTEQINNMILYLGDVINEAVHRFEKRMSERSAMMVSI